MCKKHPTKKKDPCVREREKKKHTQKGYIKLFGRNNIKGYRKYKKQTKSGEKEQNRKNPKKKQNKIQI